MRKIFTLLCVVLTTSLLYANDYTPLVREGVKWHCRMDVVSAITEKESYPYTIEIKGDTIINDVIYKKCYYTFEDESVATNDIPRAFLREDIGEKKVYALYNYDYTTTLPFYPLGGYFESFTEGLLYDFNDLANTNQGWHEFMRNGEGGITTETITLNSKEYVKTTVNNMYVFIEGIGFVEFKDLNHEGDFLYPSMPRLASAFSPEALPIFCSFEDETGKVIYTSEMAHNYIPLVREGVKWNCRMDVVSLITETESYPYTIEIKGDTIINAVRYKKCYYTFEDESVATNDIPRAFLREYKSEKKVYALYNYDYTTTLPLTDLYEFTDETTEVLLYDFKDLTNEKQVWADLSKSWTNDDVRIEKIMLNSQEYQKTALGETLFFIEGIGFVGNKEVDHEGDLLNPTVPRLASAYSPEALPIFCSFEDETGMVIYTTEYAGVENLVQDSNNISIEICNNNINIIATQSLTSVRIINMAGMVVDVVCPNENTITIPTDKYPTGCYIIQVATESDITTQKISI